MRLCNLVCFDFVDAIYLVGYEMFLKITLEIIMLFVCFVHDQRHHVIKARVRFLLHHHVL